MGCSYKSIVNEKNSEPHKQKSTQNQNIEKLILRKKEENKNIEV